MTRTAPDPQLQGIWVDHHLMLNAMALLRHRLVSESKDALELMDAITGFFSVGLYVQQRAGIAQLDRFVDWFECLATLRRAVDPSGVRWLVAIDVDESPKAVQLNALAMLSRCVFESTPPGRNWSIGWRSVGNAIQLSVAPDAPDLRHALLQWQEHSVTVLETGGNVLTCQIALKQG